ncbi:uncharacterized protein LOC121738173 [Aricia agestis]|uniref:uncharacterized protein LOC121738173 n=1 Tax=Aricia agestis TaxID=91739 RepID=UPI001C2056BE|nr:uncharacterized protein LOC121738173 [Aricia agestis]
MESLRAVIFMSAILNLVNAQASYGYQPIAYRPSPLDSNNNLNVLKEFNNTFWDDRKGLSYRFNPEVEIDLAPVINYEKERNRIQKPVLINQKIWNDQKGLSYRFNPEVEIDLGPVINYEKERNRIQKPVFINPINLDDTLGRYDLKSIGAGDALKYIGIPQLNIQQASIKHVAIPKKLGALLQSRKRINNFNGVGNNLAMLPKEVNSHNHISRTSFQIRHSKQTNSVSGKVGSTHISNPLSLLPREEKFEEIENTNKASDLIKQPIDANAIIEPPKPILRFMDVPSIYGISLKADEQPKTFLSYRRLNAPLENDSQVKGLSAGLELGTIADVQNQQKSKPNDANQDSTNIKEDLLTDFIINNFLSKDMAKLISSAKTDEEKKKVIMGIKNYKMMTHALIDFIRYSDPLTGHINSLKLISENKLPGSGFTTSTLEEVFEDESKAARRNTEPGQEEPEKVVKVQDINHNAGFHVIHDHRKHGPDSLKPEKDENIKRTSKDQPVENIGQVVETPFGSEKIDDRKELNNTSSESLEKPQDSVDIEPKPKEAFGPLPPRKTKKTKTLQKKELETFMKSLQVRKKIDDAFCEKLKTNEAINVMESIIRDFIEDLSYRFDKDVIMNTAEFSVNRNLHYQRDSEQDCFYY